MGGALPLYGHAIYFLIDQFLDRLHAVCPSEQHLAECKGEPSSVVSVMSKATAKSTASKEAEINLKVKQLETAQLERWLSQEKEVQEMERQQKLEEARDALLRLQQRLEKLCSGCSKVEAELIYFLIDLFFDRLPAVGPTVLNVVDSILVLCLCIMQIFLGMQMLFFCYEGGHQLIIHLLQLSYSII